ncbi:hypothetical protein EPUL_006647, partial [Erysiphe pulchra]
MMPIVDLFISWMLLSYVVSTQIVLGRRELRENGYDCGDKFFNDQKVHNVIKAVFLGRGGEFIWPYSGPLYSREMDYYTWPILSLRSLLGPTKPLWQEAMHQIVFDRDGKVIDVIVRLANYQFAKCWRVDSQRSEQSIYSVEGSNGYECGPEFIPDSTIAKCVTIAKENLGKGYFYPLQYRGNLYSEDLGLRIWPIYYRDLVIHRYPNNAAGTYFVVVDPTGQLKDVIAKTSRKKFLRCMRARKVSPQLDTTGLDQASTKQLRQGYVCHDVFFDDDNLLLASQFAKKVQLTKKPKSFPKLYNGPPFHSPCYLWPINKYGRSYVIGRMDKYRLILSLDFKVLSVAMVGNKELVPCESRVIDGDYQVFYRYRCYSDVFSSENVASAARTACKKRKKLPGKTYPVPFEGIKFDVAGPYLIYPIKKNKFSKEPGNHRIVINSMCHIAGVLTIDPNTDEL